MKRETFKQSCQSFQLTGVIVLALAAGLFVGCKSTQPGVRTDQQIASDIQQKIKGESALAEQDIQVSVANGVATLSGTVSDEASRALAGNDSGSVGGVKTVVNNLIVQPAQQGIAQPLPTSPAPQQAPPKPAAKRQPYSAPQTTHRDQPSQPAYVPPPPTQVAQAVSKPVEPMAPPPPPPPPRPTVKQVTLPEGTVIPIRITEALDSKTSQTNDVFHGALVADIGTQGVIAVPRGATVIGRIVEARDAAHFKGSALLSLELTELAARGKRIMLVTDTFSKQGEGRGKNTAEKAGGGAVLGTIIGALAGGGKGAAIGGLAGAGAGAGVNAVTRGQQAVIPSETLINFHLQSPVTLTVTIPPPGSQDNGAPSDPQLQSR
jgi:hypothetical protein